MLNKFAALVAIATMVTVGLHATCTAGACPEVKTTVEQKSVATTEETTAEELQMQEEAAKAPALASCGCTGAVEEEEVLVEEIV